VRLQLNCISPWDPDKPHYKQQEFLSLPWGDGKMKRVHAISGRGGAKTTGTVLLIMDVCSKDPGTEGLVTAPTNNAMKKGFLRAWYRIVPKSLYRHHISDGRIDLINGSSFWLGSRFVDNPTRGKEEFRGPDLDWWIDDEASLGFDPEFHTNTCAAIRKGGRFRFYAATTTPRLGEYYDFVHSPGQTVIYSTSRDNPHLPDDYVDDLYAHMSSQQAQREIEGKWVALEGLVWRDWDNGLVGGEVKRFWPDSNVHRHVYNPDKPYYLFLDLGVGNGAFVVVQRLDALSGGNSGSPIFPGSVWVAVAELMPHRDGSADRALGIIDAHFGRPAKVVCGADIDTRASTDAKTARYFVTKRWGGSLPIQPVSGTWADKQIQQGQLEFLIRQAGGNRRFCVSRDLIQLDKNSKRGINELMAQDTWPDSAGKVRKMFMKKEGRLEHVRDALLYGAVAQMAPPSYNKTNRVAA